jgi:hypothetical protein
MEIFGFSHPSKKNTHLNQSPSVENPSSSSNQIRKFNQKKKLKQIIVNSPKNNRKKSNSISVCPLLEKHRKICFFFSYWIFNDNWKENSVFREKGVFFFALSENLLRLWPLLVGFDFLARIDDWFLIGFYFVLIFGD